MLHLVTRDKRSFFYKRRIWKDKCYKIVYVVSLLSADYQTVNILGSFHQVVKDLTPDRNFSYCTFFFLIGSYKNICGAVPRSTPLRLKNDPISQGCKIPLLLCLLGNVAQLDKMSHNAHPHNHTMRSCTCDSHTILMTCKICKYVQLLYCLLFLFVSLHILSFCNNIDKKNN